ncbi:MAG: 3-oxoadipate enol-lactonase [Jatrophihabitans sp.]
MMLSWRMDGSPEAPPLVLLNSIGSTSDMWTPCLAPLAEQFRIIRIDARGHGGSEPSESPCTISDLAEDVLATLDAIGLPRVALAGLSLGGMVGLWIAIHRPERISRLALLCTSARLQPAQLWHDRAAAVRDGGMAAIADAVVARWVTLALAERDPALVEQLRAMVLSVDAESYAQGAQAIAAMDQRADLARVAAPTLVIGGADDQATPIPHQQAIVDGIPGSRLQVVDDAAHVLTYEQPGHVAALLAAHFAGGGTLAGGYAVRRAVLGDRHVDDALAATTELTAAFQQFITRYAWGDVWTRPELTRRERSIATLAALTTLGAEHELATHVRGAVRNGLSPVEIIGVLHHTAIYAGVPRANRAIAIAVDVLTTDIPSTEAQ